MATTAFKGINETIAKLQQFGKATEKQINAEIEATAFQIESDAKKFAPKNFGKLAQSISHEKVKNLTWRVTVNESYGAYLEFGTGHKVKVPPEFKEIAEQFRGSGRGPQQKGKSFEDGLESIVEWCKAKGIPIIQAKWIFLKILGAGINPRPFLYPAYQKGKKDLLKNLEKLVKVNKKI